MKIRGFEVVSKFKDSVVELPKRGTKDSACYDLVAIEDITLVPMAANGMLYQEMVKQVSGTKVFVESLAKRDDSEGAVAKTLLNMMPEDTQESLDRAEEALSKIFEQSVKPVLVPTGIKAYMGEGEVLKLFIRSSSAVKKGLQLANCTAVVDKDYYNNESNEGHIFIPLINTSIMPVKIKKGERIAQAMFQNYLLVDGDEAEGTREGGFGSTGGHHG